MYRVGSSLVVDIWCHAWAGLGSPAGLVAVVAVDHEFLASYLGRLRALDNSELESIELVCDWWQHLEGYVIFFTFF